MTLSNVFEMSFHLGCGFQVLKWSQSLPILRSWNPGPSPSDSLKPPFLPGGEHRQPAGGLHARREPPERDRRPRGLHAGGMGRAGEDPGSQGRQTRGLGRGRPHADPRSGGRQAQRMAG